MNFALLTALLASLLALVLLVDQARLWWLWRRVPALAHPEPASWPPLSVIVSAHQEAARLPQLLSALLHQDYPQYEVLIVLDHCEDDSAAILRAWSAQYPQLGYIDHQGPGRKRGKKAALSAAIQRSRHPYLVFTDADAERISPHWLSFYGRAFAQKFELVLGFGPLYGPGPAAGLSAFETWQTAGLYFAAAAAQKPYMGVGRNMGYAKALFTQQSGFAGHEELLSGDDDLFVSALSRQNAVCALAEPQSYVYSPAPTSLARWWAQKRRHYSTAWHYPAALKFYLAGRGALQLLYYLLLGLLFYLQSLWALGVLALGLLRFIWPGPWLEPKRRAFFWLWAPWAEATWALLSLFIHTQNAIFGHRKKW